MNKNNANPVCKQHVTRATWCSPVQLSMSRSNTVVVKCDTAWSSETQHRLCERSGATARPDVMQRSPLRHAGSMYRYTWLH